MSISKTTTIIEQHFKKQRITNVNNLQLNPQEADLKIKNHCERWGNVCSYESILEKIKKDVEFATMFAKDPAKQNESEILVSQLIQQNPIITNFQVLPKSGTNSIRIGTDGNLIFGNQKTNDQTINRMKFVTKSVDFYFKIDNEIYYCTQKFTRGTGGSQDNQCNEVKEFLTYGSRNMSSERRYFVAILDGDYFNSDKINTINATFSDYKHVFAESADFFMDNAEDYL